MLKIDGIGFNLGFALSLSEEEFRGHFAPIFKNKKSLDKAWETVLSNKNATTNREVGEPKEPELRRNTKKTGDKGVYNTAEPETDIH
jgi:hypothetical protein